MMKFFVVLALCIVSAQAQLAAKSQSLTGCKDVKIYRCDMPPTTELQALSTIFAGLRQSDGNLTEAAKWVKSQFTELFPGHWMVQITENSSMNLEFDASPNTTLWMSYGEIHVVTFEPVGGQITGTCPTCPPISSCSNSQPTTPIPSYETSQPTTLIPLYETSQPTTLIPSYETSQPTTKLPWVCPSGLDCSGIYPGNQKIFMVPHGSSNRDNKNLLDAQQYCNDLSASLVSIESEEENYFLYEWLQYYVPTSPYLLLGGKKAQTGEFKWIDGTPMNYTNWRGGYSSGSDVTSCIYLHEQGKWQTHLCGDKWFRVICQKYV